MVALIVLIAALYPNQGAQLRGPDQVVGAALPEFSGPLVSGGNLRLQALRGRPMLLNLWATWCGPCRREMPALEQLAKSRAGLLAVVAIDQGEDATTARAFARRFGVTFPVVVDTTQQLGTLLHLAGLPSSFFIDRDGIIRSAVDGEMTYEVMRKKAQALLAE